MGSGAMPDPIMGAFMPYTQKLDSGISLINQGVGHASTLPDNKGGMSSNHYFPHDHDEHGTREKVEEEAVARALHGNSFDNQVEVVVNGRGGGGGAGGHSFCLRF
ncbi:hypothetical protein OIU79_009971 [Salix purpurea]|uniref:Uncharacterized protein n=1 Tax=Salix purpurea TaxID=77065 RepID=A0A9Q0T8E8_SALPP|nr:hypothetical protein OIU79_009971 [Salix purpurea]